MHSSSKQHHYITCLTAVATTAIVLLPLHSFAVGSGAAGWCFPHNHAPFLGPSPGPSSLPHFTCFGSCVLSLSIFDISLPCLYVNSSTLQYSGLATEDVEGRVEAIHGLNPHDNMQPYIDRQKLDRLSPLRTWSSDRDQSSSMRQYPLTKSAIPRLRLASGRGACLSSGGYGNPWEERQARLDMGRNPEGVVARFLVC